MALFDENSEARTERPTERHRRQARERGLVAHSVELLTAARLVAIWSVLSWWFVKFATTASASLRATLEHAGPTGFPPSTAIAQLRDLAWTFLASASWPLVTVTALLLVAHFSQIGWLWRWENSAPQWSRLSPIVGLQRLATLATIGRALKLTLKATIVVGVIGFVVSPQLLISSASPSTDVTNQLTTFGSAAVQLAAQVTLALLAYAALDFAWQRWRFERSLQMTREELREELQEVEGDPRLKSYRQAQARQLAATPTSPESNTIRSA